MNMPEPTRYHNPCWEYFTGRGRDQYQFLVWAPGPIVHHDGKLKTGRTRDFWQAAWNNQDGTIGDVRKGATLDDVLHIFPPSISTKFRTVITREGYELT